MFKAFHLERLLNNNGIRRGQEQVLRFTRVYSSELRLGIQITILIACAAYLLVNARHIQQYRDLIQIDIKYLLGSILLTFMALWLGALGWVFVLRSMGKRFPWPKLTHIQLSSNLAKYLPGYGWQLVGKAYLTKKLGMSTKLVSIAIIYELLILFMSGVLLAAAIILLYPTSTTHLLRPLVILCVLCGIGALFILIALPFLLPVIVLKFWNIELKLSLAAYWLSVFVIIVGWLCFGISFWMLGASLFPLSTAQISLFMFAVAGSFLVSLAIIVIPGGIGVRESVMVYLLGPVIGSAPALLIAASSRFVWLICELSAAWTARRFANND
jgi:uncharacterized membrane protein YbhN (UPF0104 family)